MWVLGSAKILEYRWKEKGSEMTEVSSRIWGIICKGYINSHNFNQNYLNLWDQAHTDYKTVRPRISAGLFHESAFKRPVNKELAAVFMGGLNL